MASVLVIYATAHGSTREIAERIAARLRVRGLCVECVSVAEMRDLRAYDAFVLGSAVHDQAWLPEAVWFVRNNAAVLGTRPAWLFAVGIPAALAPALRGWAAREGPKLLEPMRTRVRPRDEHLFSGVVRREQLPVTGRFMFWMLGGHYGDFRDNDEIDEWADGIAHELTTGRAAEAEGTEARARADRPITPISLWPRVVLRVVLVLVALGVLVLFLREFFVNM